jgi:2-polyprenyl-3-methyl-5-hydroxy-6-metoxy-1,4-benzoquinol methylase
LGKNKLNISTQSQHKYEYETDLNGDSTGARIVRMMDKGKRVLELGAGPGSITKHLKNTCECSIVAIENDVDVIKKLPAYCEKVYNADLNAPDWPAVLESEDKFDVVLAADVLEHLYDPWAVLASMKGLLKEDGYIIVSLPHVGHNAVLACILDQDFEYQDWGLLDRTHIRFFAMKNIQSLFNSAKLKIKEAQFVVTQPELTEFSDRWRKLSNSLRSALASNKYGMVYQVVIKTVPINGVDSGIDLMSLDVDVPKRNTKEIIKSIINLYLPGPIRDMLRRLVHRLRK